VRTIETVAEVILVSGFEGDFGDRLSVGTEVIEVSGSFLVGVGSEVDPLALAHTFAAALPASHPAAVMS